MLYESLSATGVAKVKGPFSVMTWVLPKLSCKLKLLSVSGPLVIGGLLVEFTTPSSPTTVPPMLYVTAGQVTSTLVTFDVAVPLAVPGDSTQVCPGLPGCVEMLTV
jgi:hypothetical protein